MIAFGEGPKGLKTNTNPKDKNTINNARGIRIYLNQGDGTWKVQETSVLDAQRPNFGDSFAMADFNRDGKLDVFAGTRQLGNNVIYGVRQPNGILEFQPFEGVRPRSVVNVVAARDFDGDGFIDLAMGYQSNEVSVALRRRRLLGRQGGLEAPVPRSIARTARGERARRRRHRRRRPARPGRPSTRRPQVRILLGDGKRGWVEEKNVGELPPLREGCTGWMVRLKDLDGDQRDEMVMAFAGEPAGYPGMADMSSAGCKDDGAINVFSPKPKS